MSVDDQIAILGSGNHGMGPVFFPPFSLFTVPKEEIFIELSTNTDTQSWFHSQEVNVMVDSPELVGSWLRSINANQNTFLYGRVSDKDGIWRSEDGEVIQASGVAASSFIKRMQGMWKVMGKVRGTGGGF
jgi:hypothetical protein